MSVDVEELIPFEQDIRLVRASYTRIATESGMRNSQRVRFPFLDSLPTYRTPGSS